MRLLLLAALLLASVTANAANQGDGSLLYQGTYVQGWSPNGLYSAVLTASTTHDLTNFLAYGVYCAADCSVRLMPTSAKGSYPQFTVPAGGWFVAVKNIATPFVNVSGAHQWQQQ